MEKQELIDMVCRYTVFGRIVFPIVFRRGRDEHQHVTRRGSLRINCIGFEIAFLRKLERWLAANDYHIVYIASYLDGIEIVARADRPIAEIPQDSHCSVIDSMILVDYPVSYRMFKKAVNAQSKKMALFGLTVNYTGMMTFNSHQEYVKFKQTKRRQYEDNLL